MTRGGQAHAQRSAMEPSNRTPESEAEQSPQSSTPTPAPKRKTVGGAAPLETPAKVPRTAAGLVVGSWVTLKAPTRKAVDKLKASAPCLVTFLDGDDAKVLYPNQLSLFMKQFDGGILLRCRTEDCKVVNMRLCKQDDVATLDRQMICELARHLAGSGVTQDSAAASSSAQGGALAPKKLQLFKAVVARAFKDAGREVVAKDALEAILAGTFSPQEITDGLFDLSYNNKIMIADDTVFLM